MISQQAQIQELINAIDGVLSKTTPRLPWVMSGDADQQRQVLEQTRSYLTSLQHQMQSTSLTTREPGGAAPDESMGWSEPQGPGESAQQVLQAVLQEMNYLRTNMMQPMRQDIDLLREQRDALVQEIKQLESQRQHYVLPGQSVNQQQLITDFLQTLMARLQENLTGQVAQMVSGLEAQARRDRTLMGDDLMGEAPSYHAVLTPTERLEHLQRIQAQSDQLMLKLDSTLRVIFESLQSNLVGYQDSLSHGLDKMHNLGQQGEAMFSALVNRLAQQLGKEASNYLQSSIESTGWEAANIPLPTETQAPARLQTAASPTRDESSDAQIDRLLNELQSSDEATVLQVPLSRPVRPPAASATPSLGELDLLNLELDSLELDTPNRSELLDDDAELTFFQLDDTPITQIQDDEDDLTFLQVNEELTQIQVGPGAGSSIDDLDSALDLLNQISTQSHEEEAGVSSEAIAPMESVPETSYGELDEFYESLFGENATVVSEEPATPPSDRHMAQATSPTASPSEAESAEIDILSELAIAQIEADLEAELSELDAELNQLEISPDAPLTDAEKADLLAEVGLDGALEEELFGGLPDLSQAEVTPAETPLAESEPESDAIALAESAGTLSPEAIESLLFEEPVVESRPDLSDANLASNTISTLTDLIDADVDTLDALRTETGRLDEDAYIPASPEEDLLAVVETPEAPRANLEVDDDTLRRLSADLSSLEGLEGESLALADGAADISPAPEEAFPDAISIEPEAPVLAESLFDEAASTDLEPDVSAQDESLSLLPDALFADSLESETGEPTDDKVARGAALDETPEAIHPEAGESLLDETAPLVADREALTLDNYFEVMSLPLEAPQVAELPPPEAADEPSADEALDDLLLANLKLENLTPDRQELTLEGYFDVMASPAVASSSPSAGSNGDEITLLMQPQEAIALTTPPEVASLRGEPTETEQPAASAESFTVADLFAEDETAEAAASRAEPPPDAEASQAPPTLADLFVDDTEPPTAPPLEPEPPSLTPADLADLFADFAEDATSVAVPPPEAPSAGTGLQSLFADEGDTAASAEAPASASAPLQRLSSILADLFDEEAAPAEQAPPPPESLGVDAGTITSSGERNAFTLEGLGDLFEDLPSVSPPSPAVPDALATPDEPSPETIEDWFGELGEDTSPMPADTLEPDLSQLDAVEGESDAASQPGESKKKEYRRREKPRGFGEHLKSRPRD